MDSPICILYLGSTSSGSTSAHRASALERLGYHVVSLDTDSLLPQRSNLRTWFDYRTGYKFCQAQLRHALRCKLGNLQLIPKIVWVNSGELFGPSLVAWLRTLFACHFVLYCNDDPTGPRDWNRFSSLRGALHLYDLCVCLRDVNELEWRALGAPNVLRVWMSFDERIHRANLPKHSPKAEITFIGTNIPAEHRDRFLIKLIDADVPLSIHGARWQRSVYWPKLRGACHTGFVTDAGYTALLSQASLCLGLLSHRNRDLHTRRSVEAPAAFSVLLAERTSEHQLLYEQDVEALFWESPQQCAALAKETLRHPQALDSLRQSSFQRVVELGVGNEDICRQILATLAAFPD